MAKTAVLVPLDYPKLISRKIWMTEKYWNFHTVLHVPCSLFPFFPSQKTMMPIWNSLFRFFLLDKLCNVPKNTVYRPYLFFHIGRSLLFRLLHLYFELKPKAFFLRNASKSTMCSDSLKNLLVILVTNSRIQK